MKAIPYFSIITPTLNEEKLLPNLLRDLSNQTFFKDQFEVIIVDGKSEDKTIIQAKKYSEKLNLKIIETDKRNVSHQRNLGAQKARGEWILFMDADNRLPTYFLDGIKYQVEKNDKTDIFTSWITPEKKSKIHIAINQAINFGQELYVNTGSPFVLGAFIGCRNFVTDKVKFDESMKISEDSYFVKDAISEGFNFKIFKEPRYYFSLRRLEKEGGLKLAGIIAMAQISYLSGGDFTNKNFGYHMYGGTYYEEGRKNALTQLHNFISNSSKKQLENARSIFNNLKSQF